MIVRYFLYNTFKFIVQTFFLVEDDFALRNVNISSSSSNLFSLVSVQSFSINVNVFFISASVEHFTQRDALLFHCFA